VSTTENPIHAALMSASAGEFMMADEKAEAADEGLAMYVVGVEPASETRFGTQTLYYVKSAKWGRDDQRILAFTHNAFRERQAHNILTLITETSKPAGPVYLGRFRTQSGHDAWELRAEPATPPPAIPQPAPATPTTDAPQPVAAAQSFDDDLPF
jgi:hypothetical protein